MSDRYLTENGKWSVLFTSGGATDCIIGGNDAQLLTSADYPIRLEVGEFIL